MADGGVVKKERRVLIAIDRSEFAENAFKFYLNDLSLSHDEAILLHVFDPPNPPAMSSKMIRKDAAYCDDKRVKPYGHDLFLTDESNEQWVRWRIEVEGQVNKCKELLVAYEEGCKTKDIKFRSILHSGSPGEGVCELAAENRASLIVIGSRGQNKLRRTFLGSVSDYVVRHSHLPVAVVPMKDLLAKK